ncbi:hypothetical protein bcgnr5379_60530 [Bacillus cereus]|uniref:Alpha/beta hydrolase n=1 Tax=Lysobacter enzymogenes TaxID=69 RepID=A0AAU9AE98_LYSEN|nr:alpha/beta hydrolase [Lysobacter enzymogenes]BAV96268.1 hypothetical protein LEN_0781 [Lysobacter enzymogenes]
MPLAPLKKENASNAEPLAAWEYYHTPCAEYPNAPGYAAARSLDQIITHDAYNIAEAFLAQPVQIVAGSVAGSQWMSDNLFARAASADKQFHVDEGANHMLLYFVPKYVNEGAVLALFFQSRL